MNILNPSFAFMVKRINECFMVLTLLTIATVVPAMCQTLEGVVLSYEGGARIQGATIRNLLQDTKISTDHQGVFRISASLGDTLEIRIIGFLPQKRVVKDYSTLFIHMRESNELSEVIIYGRNIKKELKEIEDQYKSKGIFYQGKPPLSLLLPFGGSPITFFYELLSKDGKRARRFHKFAEREIKYYEIASRFNDHIIRNTIPIRDDELADFKSSYLPTVNDLSSWSQLDLLNYIKKSYQEFKLCREKISQEK